MSEARKNILFAVAMLLLLLAAWVAHNDLLILYVSVIFAVVLTPVVITLQTLRIRTWHPGRGLCVLALLLFVIGLLVLFFTFAFPPIQRDLRSFIEELPTRGPQSLDRLRRVPLLRHVDFSSMNAKFQDIASNMAAYAFTFVKLGAGKLFDLITGIVLTIYFILDGQRAYGWIMAMIPD